MRVMLAALVFVTVVGCGVSGPATGAGNNLRSDPCGYLSTSDFKSTLGLALTGYRSGAACSYRDQRGNTCQVTVASGGDLYDPSKTAAAKYGAVESLPAGERGFYSAQPTAPGVWLFDFGFMKNGAFAGALCGARFGVSNPRAQAAKLAGLIASRL